LATQPICLLAQHQLFFSSDHPACQFAYPAPQSYGSDAGAGGGVVGGGGGVVGGGGGAAQPICLLAQHQVFFSSDQPACQFA